MGEKMIILIYSLLLLQMNICEVNIKKKTIYVYEFGKRLNGLKLAYNFHGHISPLQDFYSHLIPDSALKKGLEKNITYLKVKCANLVSEVQVTYNPQIERVVNFFVKYPVAVTEFNILAYAKE